jgi:hypothetical protein
MLHMLDNANPNKNIIKREFFFLTREREIYLKVDKELRGRKRE